MSRFVLLLGLFTASPVLAQDPPAGAAVHAPPANSATPAAAASGKGRSYGYAPAYFDTLWHRRQVAMSQGDYTAATAVLREMAEARRRAGWPDLPVYGEALAFESRGLGATGDWKRALEVANDAMDLAPHRIATHRALAAARWGTGDVSGSFGALAGGLALVAAEPPLLWARLGSVSIMAMFALASACVALIMAALYRHFLPLTHHLSRHFLPPGATQLQATLVVTAVLFTPALLCLGAVWSVLVWVAVLGPFLERRERWGGMLAVVLLMIVAVALPTVMMPLAYPGSRQDLIYQALRDTDADVSSLGQPHGRPEEAYALGLRARWSGDGRKAALYLEKAVQQGLSSPDLFVALGNARLLHGDPLSAVQAYQKALDADPQHLLAMFNLSQVYLNLADPKATEVRNRAGDINVRAVNRLAAYAQATGLLVVDPEVPRALLSATADDDGEHARAVAQQWRWFGGATPRLAVLPAALLVLGWLIYLSRSHRADDYAHACNRCGEPACLLCERSLPNTSLCAECYEAFERDGSQQLRIRKEIDSHRYHARVLATQRVFTVLLAGGGQLLRGETIRGLAVMTLFLTTGLALLSGFEVIPETVPTYGTSMGLFRVMGGVLFAVLYILAIIDGQRERV